MVNAALLLEELRNITINPETHNQDVWAVAETESEKTRPSACGSHGCLAGNAVLHSGQDLFWEEERSWKGKFHWVADNVANPDGTQGGEISDAAASLFDLNPEEADRLFDGDNSRDKLWSLAYEITEGEIDETDYQDAKRGFEVKILKELDKINEDHAKAVKALFSKLAE